MTQLNDLKRLANGMTRSEIGQAFDELIESYEQFQSKVYDLQDKLYHESRRADEIAYVKNLEIKALQAKLDKACAALEKVKHNGCCMVCSSDCPACNAHIALNQIRKKGDNE